MDTNQQQDSRRRIRDAVSLLQRAIRFAEEGGSPFDFLRVPLSPRDGGVWISDRHRQANPELRQQVAVFLRRLVERPSQGEKGLVREEEVSVHLTLGVRKVGSRVMVTRAGRPGDLFFYRLVRLLEQVGVERLRVCQAPDRSRPGGVCGRLFLKVTRKKYCSTRCQSRTYMREHRGGDRDPYAEAWDREHPKEKHDGQEKTRARRR